MHPYTIPAEVKERVMRRQGKLPSHDTIDASRTALVVVDMQNYFVAEGFPLEVPAARGIVPNINRWRARLRAPAAPWSGCRPPRSARSKPGAITTNTC